MTVAMLFYTMNREEAAFQQHVGLRFLSLITYNTDPKISVCQVSATQGINSCVSPAGVSDFRGCCRQYRCLK